MLHPPFKPLPLIKSGIKQTLVANFWPHISDLKYNASHIIELEDKDKLSLLEYYSIDSDQPIILMIHGLTGSHKSNYMSRLTKQLYSKYRVFRLNLRGCGTGKGLAKNPYHSGRSEDIVAVLNFLISTYPNKKIHLLGFSLGANIILKMAGEFDQLFKPYLQSIIAISPPLDLHASVKKIIAPQNKIFNQYFTRALINSINDSFHLSIKDKKSISKVKSVYEFDDIYTAPICGFENALDYYNQCSSKNFLTSITTPTLILHSKDDPLISSVGYDPKKYHNSSLTWIQTQYGGHVGFIGYTPLKFKFHWMDSLITAWLDKNK